MWGIVHENEHPELTGGAIPAIHEKGVRMMLKRINTAILTILLLCQHIVPASAAEEGRYTVEASLSCYVNAMGGVEFGAPLLTSAEVNVGADGTETMTLHFTKSSVTIYSVTCDTFIDVNPAYVTDSTGVQSGTIGYYRDEGTLVTEGVSYELSDDTALNARQEQVHYVSSITFPVESEQDAYYLTLYVNSNVMGTQFTKGGYEAVLSVDWSRMEKDTSAQQAQDAAASQNENPSGSVLPVPAQTEVTAGNRTGTDSTADQTDTASSGDKGVQENKGLNIYEVGEDAEENVQTQDGGQQDSQAETEKGEDKDNNTDKDKTQTAQTSQNPQDAGVSIQKPVVAGISATGGIMIIAGVVLVVVGRKEKKNEKKSEKK